MKSLRKITLEWTWRKVLCFILEHHFTLDTDKRTLDEITMVFVLYSKVNKIKHDT